MLAYGKVKVQMAYTAEELETLFRSGRMERLGMGSRRVCYRVPDTGFCVKCYRSEEEIAEGKHPGREPFKPLAASVVREIRRHRFSEEGNTSCQEWHHFEELRRRLPPELLAVFPETLERILVPGRGWCLVEDEIRNADGSPVRKFHEAYIVARDEGVRAALLARMKGLCESLAHNAVRFYDPQNVLVQWMADGTFRLRIVDFEPASRALIPLDRFIPGLVGLKVRRRFARYLKNFDVFLGEEAQIASRLGRVNVLCMKWGDYYTADYVNRLYAGVKHNLHLPFRFVCVTDDATGFNPGIEAVPFPPDPKVPGTYAPRPWPNIFAKLALFQDGFAGLSGPTLFLDIDLLVTGPLERFFLYRPGEFCIIHNWVERRKALFRKTPDIGNSSCFRFEAGKSNGVWETFLREKDDPARKGSFRLGSQKFQTYAMMRTGKVNWWPSGWVCSFKRQLVPIFPLNKLFRPWRPPKAASIVAFHGQPDLPQALEGYYLKYGKPVKPHLTCRPTKWITEYWHE